MRLTLERERAEKENAHAAAASSSAAAMRARQSTQELADALAATHSQTAHLQSQLQAAQAALAERGCIARRGVPARGRAGGAAPIARGGAAVGRGGGRARARDGQGG